MAKQNTTYEFSLIDGVTKGVRSIIESLGSVGKAVVVLNQGFDLAGKAIGAVGKIAEAFASPVAAASTLEDALARVGAITGATADEFPKLREAILAATRDTGDTIEQASAALEELARQGFNATDAANALTPVLQFAKVANLETAQAAGLLADTLDQFGAKASDASKFANEIAQAARAAGTGVGQMAEGFTIAGPAARAAGADFETTAAAMGLLAKEGIEGSRAGKALAQVFTQLADPASKLREELSKLGINSSDLGTVLEQLGKQGTDTSGIITALGAKLGPAFAALIRQGKAGLDEFKAGLADTGGVLDELSGKIEDTLSGTFAKFKAALSGLFVGLGEPILEPLKTVLAEATKALNDFVTSPQFAQIRDAIGSAFKAGAAAVQEFVQQVDLKDVARKIAEFVNGSGERLASFTTSTGNALNALQTAFDALKITVGIVGAAIALTVSASARAMDLQLTVLAQFSKAAAEAKEKAHALAVDGFDLAGRLAVIAGTATGDFARHVESAGSQSETATPKIKGASDAFRDVATAADEAAKKSEEAGGAIAKAGDQQSEGVKKIAAAFDAFRDVLSRLDGTKQAADDSAAALAAAQKAAADATARFNALAQSGTHTREEMLAAAAALTQATTELQKLSPAAQQANVSLDDSAAAATRLGITLQKDLNVAATNAAKDLQLIVQAQQEGTRTTEDVTRAFLAYAYAARKAAQDSDASVQAQVEANIQAKGAALGVTDALQRLGLAGQQAGQQVAGGAQAGAAALDEEAEAAEGAAESTDAYSQAAKKAGATSKEVSSDLGSVALVAGSVSQAFVEAAASMNRWAGQGETFRRELNALTGEFRKQQQDLQAQIDLQTQIADQQSEEGKQLSILRLQYPLLGDEALRQLARIRAANQEALGSEIALTEAAKRRLEIFERMKEVQQQPDETQVSPEQQQGPGATAGAGRRLDDTEAFGQHVERMGRLLEQQTAAFQAAMSKPTEIKFSGIVTDTSDERLMDKVARALEPAFNRLRKFRR